MEQLRFILDKNDKFQYSEFILEFFQTNRLLKILVLLFGRIDGAD